MKKCIVMALLSLLPIGMSAQKKLVPSYLTTTTLIDKGETIEGQYDTREKDFSVLDGNVVINIAHEPVTKARETAVKAGKRESRLVTAGAVLNGKTFGERLYAHQVNKANNAQTSKMMGLSVEILIENKSDKEIMVVDANSDIRWTIDPHWKKSYVSNTGLNLDLKVSYTDEPSTFVEAVIQAQSSTEMMSLELEMEDYCIYRTKKNGYLLVNNATQSSEPITKERVQELKDHKYTLKAGNRRRFDDDLYK